MANREMPASRVQHRKLLELQKAGVYTTEDPQGKQNVFREYQQFGMIPMEFDSPRQLQDTMQELIKAGVPKKQALSDLGIGVDIFNPNGSINGRGIRDRMSPGLKNLIDERSGEGTSDQLAALERKGWRAAQEENRAIGETLGMKINAGHYDTSASGAPASNRAAGTESAVINQINGRSPANPSRPLTENETSNIGVANTKALGLFEAALEQSGLPARSGTQYPLNPYVSALVGSDDATRYIPKDQLESINRTFQDLTEQGYSEVAMYDHIKSGGALDAKSLATAGTEKRGVSTFAQATPAGPLKIVQKAKPKEVKPTIVQVHPPRAGTIESPSVSRGKLAAAIATRESLPAARPTVKPLTRGSGGAKPSVRPRVGTRGASSAASSSSKTAKTPSPINQIRTMVNSTGDALRIYPGMGLPSNSLIQGL